MVKVRVQVLIDDLSHVGVQAERPADRSIGVCPSNTASALRLVNAKSKCFVKQTNAKHQSALCIPCLSALKPAHQKSIGNSLVRFSRWYYG